MADATLITTGDLIPYTNSGAAAIGAGSVIAIGVKGIGVTPYIIGVGDTGGISVGGVYDLATASATTFSFGDVVQWDTTNNVAVTSGGVPAGIAVKACVSGDTTVRVKLVLGVDEESSSSSSSST